MAKEKFPSQIKYEKENPAITFRMKKEEKERIVQMQIWLEKVSLNFYEQHCLVQKKIFQINMKKAHSDGYNCGYNNAKSIYRIWFFCFICGKVEDIQPNTKIHNVIIEYLKEKKWSHSECVNKTQLINSYNCFFTLYKFFNQYKLSTILLFRI